MWTYAHQGQHPLCYWCGTYVCDSCVVDLHSECTDDPCQCPCPSDREDEQ